MHGCCLTRFAIASYTFPAHRGTRTCIQASDTLGLWTDCTVSPGEVVLRFPDSQSGLAGEYWMSLTTWLIVLFVLGLVTFALVFAFIPACDKV